MHFVYPQFLWALGLLSIPIALHLFAFRRYKTVYFSNVALLKEVQQQQSSHRNLRKLLILLARLLALTAIILAFAQPYWGKEGATSSTAHYRTFFLDNTWSMNAKVGPATQLDLAKQQAIALIRQGGEKDRYQIVTADAGKSGNTWLDPQQAIQTIEAITWSSTAFRYADYTAAFAAQTEDGFPVDRYFFSDFQKNAGLPKTSDSAQAVFVQLKTATEGNIAIDTAYFLEPAIASGVPAHLLVRLHQFSDQDAEVEYSVSVNGRNRVAQRSVLAAKSVRQDTLLLSLDTPGWQEIEVLLNDGKLGFDNQFRLTAFASGKSGAAYQNTPSCLPAAQAIRVTDLFKLDPWNTVNGNPSEAPALLISAPGSNDWDRLKGLAENGTVLLLFPDFNALPLQWANWLNVQVKGVTNTPAILPVSELRQSWFADVLNGINPNLQMPEFRKYLDAGVINPALSEVVFRLDNGKPLLLRIPVGKGMVYLFTADLLPESGNFSRYALFAPIVFKMAAAALGKGVQQAGQSGTLISMRSLEPNADQVYHLRGSSGDYIPRVVLKGNERLVSLGELSLAPGFYTLLGANDSLRLAINPVKKESEPWYYSSEELSASGKLIELAENQAGSASLAPAMLSNASEAWKWLIWAALGFLLAEVLLLRFMKQ